MCSSTIRTGSVLVLALLVVLAGFSGVAAAETRFDSTVVVGPGETVTGGLDAFATTVVVQGTVQGDLNAFATTVRVEGTVTGNVNAFATNVELAPGAVVQGDLNAFATGVTVAGAVGGDITAGAETLRLASTADVAGDVRYDAGTFTDDGATVGGSVVFDDDLSNVEQFTPVGDLDFGLFGAVYGLVVAGLVGAIALLAFPTFSERVRAAGTDEPLRTGGVALAFVLGVPVLLIAVAITVVGIPLSLAGLAIYLIALWIGSIYGRFIVGSWLLGLGYVDNRWLGLAVGLLVYYALGWIPAVGGFAQLVVSLLGIGALALSAYRVYRGRSAPPAEGEGEDASGVEPGTPVA